MVMPSESRTGLRLYCGEDGENVFKWWTLFPLTLVILLATPPVHSIAQTTALSMPVKMSDVELGVHGEWSAKIVDAEGIGVEKLPVSVSKYGGPIAYAITDQDGRFAFSNLSTGVHLLECDGVPRLYRFWKSGTAPPKAVQNSLIVTRGMVVRGVQGSRVYDWVSDHWVLTYTGIAAAIVVPVVLIGSNQDSAPASP